MNQNSDNEFSLSDNEPHKCKMNIEGSSFSFFVVLYYKMYLMKSLLELIFYLLLEISMQQC